MSTEFYLDCKFCKQAVHLTDNKINPPINKELLKTFLIYHGWHKDCNVVLESEHTIEYEHVHNFKDEMKDSKGLDI